MRAPNPVRLGSREAPPPRQSQKRGGSGSAHPQAPSRSLATPASRPGVTVARLPPTSPAPHSTPPMSHQASFPTHQVAIDRPGSSARTLMSKRCRVEEKGKGVVTVDEETAKSFDNAIDQMPTWIAASIAMVAELGDSALFNEVEGMANPARLKKFAELLTQVITIAPLATYSWVQELSENSAWEQKARELEAKVEPLKRQVVDLERQLVDKERALKKEVTVRNEQMGILQTQCTRARREIDSLRGEVAEKDTYVSSLVRELKEVKGETAGLRKQLQNSAAEQQVLEEDLREMEMSFNDTVQKSAEDTLYGIWFHYPDLDYSRVDPSYEVKASEWRAEKAVAQEVRGSDVPAEEATGDGLDPLFTPPAREDEVPPPPPPVDEPIPPPPANDPAPVPSAKLGSNLPEPPVDLILIVDLSPVREERQEPGQCQGQDFGQGA